jgi:low temperature requirement protein LtrA
MIEGEEDGEHYRSLIEDLGSVRSLVSVPKVLNEWGTESEERGSGYWELFLDLVLVAGVSNVADSLKENMSANGLLVFILFFVLYYTSWSAYMHFTTRFGDDSLAHSVKLFVFILALSNEQNMHFFYPYVRLIIYSSHFIL